MKSGTDSFLAFCRARSRALYDTDNRVFLGTASAINPSFYLTCLHCVGDRETVSIEESILHVETRIPSADLALLRSDTPQKIAHFIASSDDATLGNDVLVYGFRRRDGLISDVLFATKIGSSNERALAPGFRQHQLCGFERRNLLEAGMSGGVVLDASTLEIIGYVIGYEELKEQDRRDDLFIVLSSAITESDELRRALIFSHQRRAALMNIARRFMSLSGFSTQVETLGSEPGLDECLICTRGTGIVAYTLLVVAATSKQLRDSAELTLLHELSKKRAFMRGIHFDKAIVAIDEPLIDDELHSFVASVHDLTFPGRSDELNENNRAKSRLLGDRLLPRSVVCNSDTSRKPAFEAVENALAAKARIVAITGPLDSGKRTLVEEFAVTLEARALSGDRNSPTILRLSLSNDLEEAPISPAHRADSLLVIFTDLDQSFAIADSTSLLRALRGIIAKLDSICHDWAIILPIAGGVDQTKRTLRPLGKDLVEGKDWIVLELLPLSGEFVRETLRIELGTTEGEGLWKEIISSQEIFQIAQWPAGLSLILDRAVRALLSSTRLSQVQIIASLVNGYLSRDTRGFPPSATFCFLISLAKEINATQRMFVSVERARRIYAGTAPEVHVIHSIAVSDVLVFGLLSLSWENQSVFFENAIFLHYFLAIGIVKSVNAGDLTAGNPLYHRRIPVALLSDVVDLGIDKDQLWTLIKATAGGASKPTEGSGFIGGNSVSLLRLLNVDFRNAEFANCDLRGAIFTRCDLSGADFTNAVLVDASLSNTNLAGANFTNADLERAI